MFELYIEVDTNDGDYVSATNNIKEETLDKIRPLITAIVERQGDYQTGEMAEEPMEDKYPDFDTHEIFQSYCPWPEYGFHTIERITVCPTVEKEVLL